MLPFTATDQRLSVRVWAPKVGMPIMMKLKMQTNGAINVEARDTTTVAGAWMRYTSIALQQVVH